MLLHTMSQGTDLELGTTEFCSFFWGNMINNINNKSIISHNLEDSLRNRRMRPLHRTDKCGLFSSLIPGLGLAWHRAVQEGDRNV